ncbi:MAG: hypothetical protein QW416_06920 [Candidatus Nitrosocaldaceae archaeon]
MKVFVGDWTVEGILTYEGKPLLVHLFSVTNTAATRDHKGRWSDDKTLNLVYEGLQEDKKYKEEITIKLHSPREWSVNEVDTLNGQVISTMEVTLKK